MSRHGRRTGALTLRTRTAEPTFAVRAEVHAALWLMATLTVSVCRAANLGP